MPPFYFLTFAKVSVSVSKKFGLKKVSVSVSKTFGLEKKSRYRSRKHLVSKKSLGIGLENIWSRKKVSVSVSKIFGLEKKSRSRSRKFWSRKKVSVSVSMKFFGLVTQCGRVEIKSLQLINFNTGRVNSEKKLLHCNYSPQWVFKCVLRQLVKIDSNFELACFDICKENLWSLSRTTGEESQLWVIRTQSGLWKGVPLTQKEF